MFVLVNGSPTDEGDSLSPFLFLLAAEGLNVMMKVVVKKGLFQGYDMGS